MGTLCLQPVYVLAPGGPHERVPHICPQRSGNPPSAAVGTSFAAAVARVGVITRLPRGSPGP
jgi:hypothetical protein